MDEDAKLDEISRPLSKGTTSAIVESSQFSANLYHFSWEPKWILKALSDGYLIANYNNEPMEYLQVENLPNLAISMICFCDIPLVPDRIRPRTSNYGKYGIGFSKDWGIKNGVSPVHYVVPTSPHIHDFRDAYYAAMATGRKNEKNVATISDFLITQLAYSKPVQDKEKCYEDECEWRYVPNASNGWMPIRAELSDGELSEYRGAQEYEESIRLRFDMDDITHLLVPDNAGVRLFIDAINSLGIDDDEKDVLKTKIRVVGDESAW